MHPLSTIGIYMYAKEMRWTVLPALLSVFFYAG